MNQADKDRIISEAIPLAQKKAQGRAWKIGDTICHPKEPITCVVKELLPDGLISIGLKEIEWTVPVDEVFDPNEMQTIALNLKFGFPPQSEGTLINL